ncbi:carbohydrate ABC transporter permease [Actinospica durhamensis]|uniref:Carbohydrate ABC transporter permease n=1 Tax=Actinospica durhamensis TaxID=1508375 RepID=A0A941EII0_9ACTN|nr:carbohydrate ABC transporter permease [Actinospica durhamensis]MBR7832127.1 carbohydrate ABC transporter permease [Actinospica durhamensis]
MTAQANPLRRLRERGRDNAAFYAVLVIGAALWLFPLVSTVRQSVQFGGFHNYLTVLTTDYNGVNLLRAFANSLLIAALTVVLTCGIGALAGYAFAKIDFVGREGLYHACLLLLAVPAVAIMVPVYWITGNLGLFNSPVGVSLPEVVLTLPFAVLLLRNNADSIPDELIEAARIDGASHLVVFRHIFLPLSRPALINLAALCVVWSIQDFIFSSMLLTNASSTTAAQAVQSIQGAFSPTPIEHSQYFAALMLLAVPAIVIVVLGLRFITQGMTAGGVKE